VATAAPVARPIVVVFRASWAAASRELAERTLADPRVEQAFVGAEVSYVDATDSDEPTAAAAIAREHVSVLPCIVVHAAARDGREYLNGFVTAEVLLAALDRASQ
jgi:thiol:disulfide interchange protein